jgi:hypothetical protein
VALLHQFRRLAGSWKRRTDIHHGFLALTTQHHLLASDINALGALSLSGVLLGPVLLSVLAVLGVQESRWEHHV